MLPINFEIQMKNRAFRNRLRPVVKPCRNEY